MRILRDLARALLLGLGIGVVTSLLLFTIDAWSYLSRSAVFDKVQVGASESNAIATLGQASIWCDVPSVSNVCRFSDYWRDYEIGIDPARRIVSSKSSFPVRRDRVTRKLFRF